MMNGKDPLTKTADGERELFTRLAKVATGFSTEQAVGAAANLIVNAIRQNCSTQRAALDNFDAVMTHVRAVLAEHYDTAGRRRNIFPFDQVISAPLFDARPKERFMK